MAHTTQSGLAGQPEMLIVGRPGELLHAHAPGGIRAGRRDAAEAGAGADADRRERARRSAPAPPAGTSPPAPS